MTLLLTLLLFFAPPVHDYHVSKTNVRYLADRSQVQVEMQVFVDDLEAAMQDAGAPALELGTENQEPDSDRYLVAYLEKHFRIEWNGQEVTTEFVGWELDDDMHGLWIYLSADDVEPPEQVVVENSVLTEFYADQKNIVKLFNGKERMATLLMDRDKIVGRAAPKTK